MATPPRPAGQRTELPPAQRHPTAAARPSLREHSRATGLTDLGAHAPPVSGRFLGLAAMAWTTGCAGWLGWTALEGKLDTTAVAIAVAGFVGVVWLLGLLILSLFRIGRDPSEDDTTPPTEGLG